jgi:hypothetical protein
MARKRQLPLKNAWVTANLPPNLTQRNETETNVGSGKTTKKNGDASVRRRPFATGGVPDRGPDGQPISQS